MSRTFIRAAAVLLSLSLVAAACGGDDDEPDASGASGSDTSEVSDIDLEATGLWDDGPCDESLPTLHVGQITTFESPVISLEDGAIALEAAAEGFNARGGANGSCIEVTNCDDGANLDQAVGCVRTLKNAGVVATIKDQVTAGHAEVAAAMTEAAISRVGLTVSPLDWADPNSYPLDSSGIGSVFVLPKALIEEGVSEIGVINIDSPGAGVLPGLLGDIYEGEATFPFSVPVAVGTTDYSQFILAAQDAGVDGVILPVGEQEAVQVLRAGQQLGTDLSVSATLSSFSHAAVADFGDFAEQLVFVSPYPPATADLPAYDVLRADLSATGEEGLQLENLRATPARSWIGLYALLKILRDAGTTEFSSANITAALQAATDVDMLGIYGDATWTPNLDHPGMFKRAGIPRWASFAWDPDAAAPGGLEGNWVELAEFDFDEIICGSPFGAPAGSC